MSAGRRGMKESGIGLRPIPGLLGMLGLLGLGACRPAPAPPAAGGEEPIAATYEALRAQGANLERGRVLSLSCVPCHSFAEGGAHSIGPNLYRVFGRAAATRSDFAYSPALLSAGIVWTPTTLNSWLADPAGFVPGTTMVFAGFKAGADRRDLIAYLLRETGGAATAAGPRE